MNSKFMGESIHLKTTELFALAHLYMLPTDEHLVTVASSESLY